MLMEAADRRRVCPAKGGCFLFQNEWTRVVMASKCLYEKGERRHMAEISSFQSVVW